MANTRIPGPLGMHPMHIDSGTLARTRFSSPGPIGLNEIEPNTVLDQSKRELAFDIGQLILDITGIFDPSPISDGTSFLISLARGNWLDAATSAVSIVPYIGDLAKTAKLPKYLQSVRKAIRVARLDSKWAHALRALFVKLKKVLDKGYELSADLLPNAAGKQLKALKDEIDDFLKPRGSAAGNLPEGGIKTKPRSSKPIKSTGDLEQPQTVGNLDKNTTKGHGGNENNVGPKTEEIGDFEGFDSSGILQRNGKRTVLNQGPHQTCGPTSCGMILDDLLPNRAKTSLGGYRGVTSKGITADKLADLLKSNGVDAKFKMGLSVEDLANATSKGKPAIAAIRVGNGGHAVVVDGITTKLGEKVVAIRNPWGKQYFQKVSEFKKVFLRQGVIIK